MKITAGGRKKKYRFRPKAGTIFFLKNEIVNIQKKYSFRPKAGRKIEDFGRRPKEQIQVPAEGREIFFFEERNREHSEKS